MAKKTATMDLRTGAVTTNFDFKPPPGTLSPENMDTLRRLQGGDRPTHFYHMGLSYIYCLMNEEMSAQVISPEKREGEAKTAVVNFLEMYGTIQPTFDYRGLKVRRPDDLETQVKVICKKVKRYFENNEITELTWKTVNEGYINYYTLEWTGSGDEELDIFRLMIHDVSDGTSDYLNTYSLVLRTSNGSITPMLYGVIAKDRKESTKAIQVAAKKNQLGDLFMNIILHAIESIRMITSVNRERHKMVKYDGFSHTPGEIHMMKRILKEVTPPPVIRPILTYDWTPDTFKGTTRIYYEMESERNRNRPQIQLTNSEWKTVRDYVNYEYPDGTTIPMHRIINHLPYGEYLMLHYPLLFKKDTIPLKINIVAKDDSIDEDGMIREGSEVDITIWYTHDDNYQYCARFNIENLTDNLTEGCDIVLTAPLILNSKLPATEKELLGMFPKDVVTLFTEFECVKQLCSDILDMIIIMHDRPEKFVQIEEKTKRGLPKNRLGKPSQKDREYVTRYIIKTVYQGRKYVKQHTDGNTIRRYVMEHWKRRGHWRTLASGKQIWIEEAECKRHLEMSETPVVINYEEATPRRYKIV